MTFIVVSVIITGVLAVVYASWDKKNMEKHAVKNQEYLRSVVLKKIKLRNESIDDWPGSADALRGERPLTVKEIIKIMTSRGA